MKILIVSGFLGAGKTTFIKRLAKETGSEIAILENEYAASGVDKDVLRDSPETEGLNIWEMAEGCICCSTRKDFAESVLTIANSIDPEYLVIEPTGVGVLSNIIRNLQAIEYERITLLAPVTILDGLSWRRYLREYRDLYEDQLKGADQIIVSKMEQAPAEELDRLEEQLRQINPEATVIRQHYSTMPKNWWQRILETGYDKRILKKAEGEIQLPDSFSLEQVKLWAPEELILSLEKLIRGGYGDVIRAKGCIHAGDTALRFDVADGRYAITGAEADTPSKAVFIGKNIRRQEIRKEWYTASDRIRIERGEKQWKIKSRTL